MLKSSFSAVPAFVERGRTSSSQAEVCSGTVAEVVQSVVNGADGCIFCFGQVKLGKIRQPLHGHSWLSGALG